MVGGDGGGDGGGFIDIGHTNIMHIDWNSYLSFGSIIFTNYIPVPDSE